MTEQVEERKPALSPGRIGMMLDCGYAYKRRYIDDEVIPPGVAMARGTGVHGGAEYNFAQKMETREDLPVKDIVEVAVASFEQEVETADVHLNPEEEKRGRDIVLAEAKDITAVLAQVHAEHQAPKYQPTHVEQWARICMPGSKYDLNGRIDLIAEGVKDPKKPRVRDIKTASRKKSQSDVDRSLQLQFYAAATAVLTGLWPEDVGLEVVIETKGGKSSAQELTCVPTKRDMETMVHRINAVVSAIEAGVFLPAAIGSWRCSSRWCGYAATCPHYNAERDPYL